MSKKSIAVLILCSLFATSMAHAAGLSTDPALIGWWPCDEGEGNVVADVSGNGNDGVVSGTAAWEQGVYGNAILMQNQLIEVPAVPQTVTEATIAGWVKPSGSQPDWSAVIFIRGDGAGANVGATGLNVNGLELRYHWGGANWAWLSGVTIADGEWNFIAMTVNPDAAVFYLDGEEGATNAIAHASVNLQANINLGGDGFASFPARRFSNAVMDDISFFSRALTADEIPELMQGLADPTFASKPSPRDEAGDILRDSVLAWAPGISAATHDVYVGTDFAEVDNATEPDAAGLDANSYDPGRLEFGTTYYWRVDEVNSAPDNTVFKGSVWSFATEPKAYEIENVAASASSVHEAGMEADRTIDGSGLNAEGEHSADLAQMWLSNMAETEGVWVQYDLGKLYKLNHIHVWNHNSQTESILGYGIKEALIETSTDGETWTELKTTEFAQATGSNDYTGADVPLDSVVAQHVRITALSNYSILGLKQFGLSEVRFYYVPVLASAPVPADNSTTDDANVLLQWRAGREADQHEVVFSDDMQTVADGTAVVGTVSESSFDLGTLDLGNTYYWKINEMNEVGTPPAYEGDLWTFLTPDHLMIDDFEMYKDQEGLRIWEFWIDGFDDQANNGAIVGDGDDAEKSVVYEGGQSMPVAFNNTTASKSEVTRYFDTPVDLTQGNAESLKLQIHGDAPGLVVDGDTITLGASGADLWTTMDEGRFVYKTLTGDGSITAKVESLADVQAWAKAGVMVRESDGADSVDAYMVTSAQNGLTFQYRLETLTAAASDTGTRSDAWINNNDRPVWVRVERVGDACNGYISLDGETWEASTSNPQTILMIPSVKIGLCATSHDNAVSTVAVFSNITTTGDVTGNWEMVEWGGGDSGHPNNDAAPMYLRLADTSGKEITLDHPNPIATALVDWDEWTIPLGDLGGINTTKIDSITVGVGSSGVQGKVFVDAIRTAKPYAEPAPTE